MLVGTVCFLSFLGYTPLGIFYFVLLSVEVTPLCAMQPPT